MVRMNPENKILWCEQKRCLVYYTNEKLADDCTLHYAQDLLAIQSTSAVGKQKQDPLACRYYKGVLRLGKFQADHGRACTAPARSGGGLASRVQVAALARIYVQAWSSEGPKTSATCKSQQKSLLQKSGIGSGKWFRTRPLAGSQSNMLLALQWWPAVRPVNLFCHV